MTQTHSLSNDEVTRIQRAEEDSFLTLYGAAAEHGAIIWESEGVRAVWSPHDDDPGFSCVMNLYDASDPVAMLPVIEREAASAGAQVVGVDGSPQLAQRVDDATLRSLGYEPDYQERFWGQRIRSGAVPPMENDGAQVERIDASWREPFARALNVGYDLPPEAVRGYIFAATIGLPGWTHYLALFDGMPGAASVLYVTEGVAQLFVTTTVPEYRGRGAQTALIRARLADALEAGCDLATSQTVVDNASPRNMARHGMEPLFDRWIYGKRVR